MKQLIVKPPRRKRGGLGTSSSPTQPTHVSRSGLTNTDPGPSQASPSHPTLVAPRKLPHRSARHGPGRARFADSAIADPILQSFISGPPDTARLKVNAKTPEASRSGSCPGLKATSLPPGPAPPPSPGGPTQDKDTSTPVHGSIRLRTHPVERSYRSCPASLTGRADPEDTLKFTPACGSCLTRDAPGKRKGRTAPQVLGPTRLPDWVGPAPTFSLSPPPRPRSSLTKEPPRRKKDQTHDTNDPAFQVISPRSLKKSLSAGRTAFTRKPPAISLACPSDHSEDSECGKEVIMSPPHQLR